MALHRTPNFNLGLASLSRKHAGQALYGLLALGAVAAIIAALFLDLKLLDGLNKADRCGGASDNLVLDNGIVLTQTMGTCRAACLVPLCDVVGMHHWSIHTRSADRLEPPSCTKHT